MAFYYEHPVMADVLLELTLDFIVYALAILFAPHYKKTNRF